MPGIFSSIRWMRQRDAAEAGHAPVRRERHESESIDFDDLRGAVQLAEEEISGFAAAELNYQPDSAELRLSDRIAERAYFRWVEAGSPVCRDVDYWLTAEREILAEIEAAKRARMQG